MQNARLKLSKLLSKEKVIPTKKASLQRPFDLPISTEMINWMEDTIYARDDEGFGSEAVTSILAQPLDSESLYCPVSSIISSKLSALRVPTATQPKITGTGSIDSIVSVSQKAHSSQSQSSGSTVQEAVDRMNVLWLQRKAAFEREEGNLGQSIKTLDEALDLHLGTKNYDNARLSDRVMSNSGTELFDAIQEKYFLYDKSAHRIASKLQNFYHRHHMKRGRYVDLISRQFRRYLAQRNYRRRQNLRNQCAKLIQYRFRLHLIRMHKLARKIQKWWRLLKYTTDFRQKLRVYRTARTLQKNWRGFKGRVRAYTKALELYMIKKIQRTARGYIYRRDRGFYVMLYHKLYYRAALRIQCLCRRIQAIRKSKNQLLYVIAREQGRIIREKSMIAETIQIEIRRTRLYMESEAGRLHYKDTVNSIMARDKYFVHIEPQLTLSEKLAQQALIAFELFDVDGSGYIDEAKLSLLLSELCIPMNKDKLHSLFLEMDKFNMGEIDFNEFLDWYSMTDSALNKENIEAQEKELEDQEKPNQDHQSMFSDAIAASTESATQARAAQNKPTSLFGRLKYRSIEIVMTIKKLFSSASGATMKLRAEREILRQSTQWLTRDSIAGFRLSCPPKFQCCQCLKPFVLFTDYFLHFDQKSGYCQVVEQKAQFYPKYWLKNNWRKQLQCEYEVVSVNNEWPKVEHFKVMAIYSELALLNHPMYAKIMRQYVGVAQRMYMHVLNPTFEDASAQRKQLRDEKKHENDTEEVNVGGIAGMISGSLKSFRRKKETVPEKSDTPGTPETPDKSKSKTGGGKPKTPVKGAKPKTPTTPVAPDTADTDKKGKKGGKPVGKAGKSKTPVKTSKSKGAPVVTAVVADAEPVESSDQNDEVQDDKDKPAMESEATGDAVADTKPDEAVLIVPLPPTMREIILQVTDVDLVREKEMPSVHAVNNIATQLHCSIPTGWLATGKYIVSEMLEWLVDEVDERVALERPFWVMTKRGKLKRDALVLGKIHVFCSRILQVAMEEALVCLFNSRVVRPRKMTIPDDELVLVGLESLTRRAYCDYNLSVVAKLDRVNIMMQKVYVPKPKHLMQPLIQDTYGSFNTLFSVNNLKSISAFASTCRAVTQKIGLVSKNSAIMSKRLMTWIFGSYQTYASIGILGAGTEVSEEVIKDYLLQEYHARAQAKLDNRFGTWVGKAQISRLSNELWASNRLIQDQYHFIDSHTGRKIDPELSVYGKEREGVDDIYSIGFIREMLGYTEPLPQIESRGPSIWNQMKTQLAKLYYFIFHTKTTLQDALVKIARLRYVYSLIASEFGAAHRAGVEKVDYDMLENRLNFYLSDTKKLTLDCILDPFNSQRLDFIRVAQWLYHRDDGIQNNFWEYYQCFSPSTLLFNSIYGVLLFITNTTFRRDAKVKLIGNQRILSRLEGDLRRHLLKSMHDDDYILHMGVYVPEPKKRGAQYKRRPAKDMQATGSEVSSTNAVALAEQSAPGGPGDMPDPNIAAQQEIDISNNAVTDHFPMPDNVNKDFPVTSTPPVPVDSSNPIDLPEAMDALESKDEKHIRFESNVPTVVEMNAHQEDALGQQDTPSTAPSKKGIMAADAHDFLMKTQIDEMKLDDERGELRVLYRQAADKAESKFLWSVLNGQNIAQVVTEAMLIQSSYDMMKTYSVSISPSSEQPSVMPWWMRRWNDLKYIAYRVHKVVDYRAELQQVEYNKPHEAGWDLTMSILVYTFDTDCTGNFDEGEINLLLQCCKRSLAEKEILYHFPQVKNSACTTDWITEYLSPRVGWSLPLTARLANNGHDRGVVSISTRNIYSTAMMSLISLNRQIALENAKVATILAKTGRLLQEEQDEKDNGCLVTRCQLLAMRQVQMFVDTVFGQFQQAVVQADDIDGWWDVCVAKTEYSKIGMLTYACYVHSDRGTRVLVTEIPYIMRMIMERFQLSRCGDMTNVSTMMKLALKYTHKLVFVSLDQMVRLLDGLFLELAPQHRSGLRGRWWKMNTDKVHNRAADALLRMQSTGRTQAIQIAFNFPNLYVPDTNYRCLILGLVHMMPKKKEMDRKKHREDAKQREKDEREREKRLYDRTPKRPPTTASNTDPKVVLTDKHAHIQIHTINQSAVSIPKSAAAVDGNTILKETAMLYLLSMGYLPSDLGHPEIRMVLASDHSNGTFSLETVDKDRLSFWGRKNEALYLTTGQKWDRWRRFFLYSVYYWFEYSLFEKTLLENRSEIDTAASKYLKELITGVSHAVDFD